MSLTTKDTKIFTKNTKRNKFLCPLCSSFVSFVVKKQNLLYIVVAFAVCLSLVGCITIYDEREEIKPRYGRTLNDR